MPSTVSPGFSSVKYTAMLVSSPRATSGAGFFRCADLIKAPLMAAAFELRLEPQGRDLVGEAERDDAAAHRENVRIVVLPRQPRRIKIVAKSSADTRDL